MTPREPMSFEARHTLIDQLHALRRNPDGDVLSPARLARLGRALLSDLALEIGLLPSPTPSGAGRRTKIEFGHAAQSCQLIVGDTRLQLLTVGPITRAGANTRAMSITAVQTFVPPPGNFNSLAYTRELELVRISNLQHARATRVLVHGVRLLCAGAIPSAEIPEVASRMAHAEELRSQMRAALDEANAAPAAPRPRC